MAMGTEPVGLRVAHHVGVVVRDLERSVAFYRALTGCEPVLDDEGLAGPGISAATGMDRQRIRYATFRLENLNLDVVQFLHPTAPPAEVGPNQPAGMHLCFEVEDVDATLGRLRELGVEPSSAPYTFTAEESDSADLAGTRIVYFDDPDGTHLELIAPRGRFVRDGAG